MPVKSSTQSNKPSVFSNFAKIIPNALNTCKNQIKSEPIDNPFEHVDFPPATVRPSTVDQHDQLFNKNSGCGFGVAVFETLGMDTSYQRPYDFVTVEPNSPMSPTAPPSNFN